MLPFAEGTDDCLAGLAFLCVGGSWSEAARDQSPRLSAPHHGANCMISLQPGTYAVRKLLGFPVADIDTQATDRWVVSQASKVTVRPAKMLPGQLDRIRGSAFGTIQEVIRDFIGGFDSIQPQTFGYRLRDVTLIDGILYNENAVRHLRPRASKLPVHLTPPEVTHATMYESWRGNRWFGNWLADDCLTYQLAEVEGAPVTSTPTIGHKADYEQRLGMHPARMEAAHFRELILFEDQAHNEGKRERASRFRRRVIGKEARRHPGVFLLRNQGGDRRVLINERAIAERLAANRGFTVIDPTQSSLEEIARACGGAEVVAGVEGSHLVHGLMLMPPEARLLVVQPPARAVSFLKMITDRQEQDFLQVIGEGTNEAFRADVEDIERTLDLA